MNENSTWDLWSRRLGAFAVAVVTAYASYQHQRAFALAGGADLTTARLWPLSIDGLLVLSTAGLLRDRRQTTVRARYALRTAFAAGIIVSLAANIATASSMTWALILVAGWPPVALLLAVELVGQERKREHADQTERDDDEKKTRADGENEKPLTLIGAIQSRRTAEQVMWDHYQHRINAGLPRRPAPSWTRSPTRTTTVVRSCGNGAARAEQVHRRCR